MKHMLAKLQHLAESLSMLSNILQQLKNNKTEQLYNALDQQLLEIEEIMYGDEYGPVVPELDIASTTEKAAPEKYSHINFKPTSSMKSAARSGLDMRKKYGRGGTRVGAERANQIVNGENLSPSTVKRMHSFFSRHEQNKSGKTPSGEPSNGRIAWLLWGGDPGQAWARKRVGQMDAADEKAKASLIELSLKNPKKGMKVSWPFGSGRGTGAISSIHKKKITRTIEGSETTRNGSEEDPALVISVDGGGTVLKLSSEVTQRS